MPDHEHRKRILERALPLFIERGYGGLTMDDIAARCHVSKRTLYRLFPAKQDLFGALVEEHRGSMLALPANYDHLSLAEAIGAIFLVDIGEEENLRRIAFLRLVMIEAQQHPELMDILAQRGATAGHDLLATWLEGEHRRGRISIEDPQDTAWMLMDFLFGVIVPKPPLKEEWQSSEMRQARLRRRIQIFLHGVAKRSPDDGAPR